MAQPDQVFTADNSGTRPCSLNLSPHGAKKTRASGAEIVDRSVFT